MPKPLKNLSSLIHRINCPLPPRKRSKTPENGGNKDRQVVFFETRNFAVSVDLARTLYEAGLSHYNPDDYID